MSGLPPPLPDDAEPSDTGGLPPPPEADVSAPPTAAAPAKMTKEEKRRRIVQELISTEDSFVCQLCVLRDLYMIPLSSSGLIKSVQHTSLFSPDLNSIILLNSQLLQSLCAQVYSTYSSTAISTVLGADLSSMTPVIGECVFSPHTSCIGKSFLDFVQFLKMYQTYVNRHEVGMKVLAELRESTKFQDYLMEMQRDPRSKGLSLESLRIVPIQRIPRYELFFRDLVKATPEAHPDYADLQRCLKEVAAV